MPPADEPGRRYRSPRHGEPDPRWGGPAAVAPVEDDPYGDVTGERPSVGRHGTPDEDDSRHDDGWSSGPRHGGSELPGRFDRDEDPDPLGGSSSSSWTPPSSGPSGRFGLDDAGRDRPSSRFGTDDPGPPPPPAPPAYGRPGPPPGGSSPYGQAPPSPPYGQAPPSPPYGQSSPYGAAASGPSSSGPAWGPPLHYGQAPPSPPYGQASPYGAAPVGAPNGYDPPNGHGPDPRRGGAPAGEVGPGADERGGPPRPATGPGSTAVQPPVDARPAGPAPLLAGGTPPPTRDEADGSAPSPSPSPPSRSSTSPSSTSRTPTSRTTGRSATSPSVDDAADDEPGTTVLGEPSRHRRGGAATGPGRDGDADDTSGPGRSRTRAEERDPGGKKKRKGSFWRELPLLVVVAIVLTFVIQTFIARIYVIPSASMEQTLHGCDGCANDRVAVDKVTYRFGDPAPGDVVVFKGPPAWLDNDEVGETQPSSNPLVRGFQDALSLVGLAAPNEKDFVKRVIATGGQTVACCDAENHVLVDGKPITEPYLYYQPGLGDKQATFDPVRVPDGQLWVMGDNRNNSADARFHGPVPVSDVIGKVRIVVLPISRWRTVPAIDPQTTSAALGGTLPLGTGTAGAAAGALLAVPVVGAGRRLRRAVAGDSSSAAPPRPGPADGDAAAVAEADRE